MKMWQMLCAAAIASPAMGDLVVNGGFEAGTGEDADGWNQLEIFGGSASASTDRVAGFGGTSAYEGSEFMYFGVIGAPDFGPVSEIQQQTAAGSIMGGETYDFSFAGVGVPGPGSVAFYEVLWFDGDGSNGGGVQGSATGLQVWNYTDSWALFGMNDLVAPDAADSILIQIRLVTGAFDGAEGWAGVDAVSMAQIPAPGALALLGIAGLGARRRRSN
ncbi:MAG: hypothetical protein GY728_10680 [Phycisphaeraceae bacterium]|nr:hypothetical protein [Phycisphaeraceae bacterium]MCP4794995.1 hypothetical protein [Phycisphaeraceae bacterium]